MSIITSSRFATLDDFIARALDYGRDRLAKSSGPSYHLRVAHSSFRFVESEPLLAQAASYCLGTADVNQSPSAQVYADYSGWHILSEFAEDFTNDLGINAFALDTHLQDMGWRAAIDVAQRRCDIFDVRSQIGVRFLPAPSAQTVWEPTAPLANFANWIGEAQGLSMVHAASVASSQKGALLVGNGGAGKSGTTLTALIHGLTSVGDDYIFLGPSFAEAVYSTVKQDESGLNRLGVKPVGHPNWQNKYVFRPEEISADPISRLAPVNALFMPKIGASRCHVTEMEPAEPFKTLTFSTLKQLGTGYRQLFERCAPIVRDLPCYTLHLSTDPVEIADTLKLTLGRL